jgi:hypothetical protein
MLSVTLGVSLVEMGLPVDSVTMHAVVTILLLLLLFVLFFPVRRRSTSTSRREERCAIHKQQSHDGVASFSDSITYVSDEYLDSIKCFCPRWVSNATLHPHTLV